jgi:hypothetical protein
MNLAPLRELPCYRYNPVNTQQEVAFMLIGTDDLKTQRQVIGV